MKPSGAAAAILAGGASRRMGRDKAFVIDGGRPMAVTVSSTLEAAGLGPTVVVGGDGDRFGELGISWIADTWPGQGPLGGVLTALDWSPSSIVVVVACDLPGLDVQTVQRLVAAVDGHDLAVASTGRAEPMCAAWRVATSRPHLAAAFAGGERAIHRAWLALDRIDVAVPVERLRNVNTPGDLRLGDPTA